MKTWEVLAGGALDDDRGEPERRVVVIVLGAGVVLKGRLALHDVDELRAVDPVALVEEAAGHAHEVQEFAQARRVREKMTDLDGLVEGWQLGNVLADVVVQRQQPALLLQHDGEGGELLRGRADVGAGLRRERDRVGEVGHPVGLRIQGAPVTPHLDGRSGRVIAVKPRHHLIGASLGVCGHRLVAQQRDNKQTADTGEILRDRQLHRVRTGARRASSEALDSLAEPSELPDLLTGRVQNADAYVDRNLIHFAKDEFVLIGVDRVADRLSGGESARDHAARLQFRGLSPRLAACDEDRDYGPEGERQVAARPADGRRVHCSAPVARGREST